MKRTQKRITYLFAIPILMFGFGYLLVPIYDVFCELTGLNGKTGVISVQHVSKIKVDQTRLVKVEFIANLNQDMNLEFAPTETSMLVHPGKRYQTTYYARNQTARAMVGQAVPSVAPSKAANYFDKVECFCFSQQAFKPKQQRELPVIFVVHPKLPKEIETITLSYTFFDVTENEPDIHNHTHTQTTTTLSPSPL